MTEKPKFNLAKVMAAITGKEIEMSPKPEPRQKSDPAAAMLRDREEKIRQDNTKQIQEIE